MLLCALPFVVSLVELGPVLPPRCSPEINSINRQVQQYLEKGDFDKAQIALNKWPIGEIHFEVVGEMIPNAKEAINDAIKAWSEVTGGKVKFVTGKNPLIRFEFVSGTGIDSPLPQWKGGVLHAPILKTIGDDKVPTKRRAIAAVMARAFGVSIGLTPVNKRGSVMGPEEHIDGIPLVFSTGERQTILKLFEVREKLEKFVKEKTRITASIPKVRIDPMVSDVGTVNSGDKPRYPLQVFNEGSGTLLIETETTCRCLNLIPSFSVSEKSDVRIEPGLDTTGFMGPLDKVIYFHTNDPDNLTVKVHLRATAVPEFRVLPDNAFQVGLLEGKPTEVDIILYATPGNPIRVLDARTNRDNVKAVVNSFHGEVFDPVFDDAPKKRLGYKITLTFPPDFKEGMEYVRVLLITDSQKTPQFPVMVQVLKGIVVHPKSVFFSAVDVKGGASRVVTISHPTEPFKILSAKSNNPQFEVQTAPIQGKNNTSYAVTVKYLGGTEGELLGVVTIETDLEDYPVITIPINGTAK